MSFAAYARTLSHSWPSCGEGLVLLERPVSTHILARRIVHEYSAEGALAPTVDLLAWQQTGGLGRDGRRWSSPPGVGIYVSLIRSLASSKTKASWQVLPLLVATALGETVNQYLAGRCRLKWPNDLLVDGRKLGGVLIDTTSRGEGDGTAVISFGLNYGEVSEPGATSMQVESPAVAEMADLAAQLVARLDQALTEFFDGGGIKADVVERYQDLSLHQEGDLLRCRSGENEIEGLFQGFDRNGFLKLQVDGEDRLLTAGEVRLGD